MEPRILFTQPVESSNVVSVAFASVDDVRGILVTFKGERQYFYPGQAKLFDEFLASESKGEFVNEKLIPLKGKKIQ